MSYSLEQAQKSIGYSFRNPGLLAVALTHKSLRGRPNNERMELLGDSVLNLVLKAWLYERKPDADPGYITTKVANIANNMHLGRVAKKIELHKCLRENISDPVPHGVYSDTLEAVIGAVFLDGGYAQANNFVRRLMRPYIDSEASLDPKNTLQIWAKKKNYSPPLYELTVEGRNREQVYQATVTIPTGNGEALTAIGRPARIKKVAEANAARSMLLRIKDLDVALDKPDTRLSVDGIEIQSGLLPPDKSVGK